MSQLDNNVNQLLNVMKYNQNQYVNQLIQVENSVIGIKIVSKNQYIIL